MATISNLTKETPNSSTPDKAKTKNVTQWFEYRDMFSWKMKPVCMESLELLADDLMKWANEKDSYRMNDFYNSRGIRKKVFYDMVTRCEKLQDSYAYAMDRIASRREIGALLRKLDASTVFRSLAHYCDIDKEQIEMKAALVAKYRANIEEHETKIVVIEKMPESKKVKAKKS